MTTVSVLIVARNAESTIERAISSVLSQGDFSIVLVDDCSGDSTVDVARRVGGSRLRVHSVDNHTTLGAARQRGLELLDTKYCLLLDADDEFLPGRVDRLVSLMETQETDAVFDEIQLYDGKTGAFLKDLRIPEFMEKPADLCRLFERNYMPGIGQMGFRVSAFQSIGYDRNLHGPEDSDIVLRGMASGLKFSVCREIGYRMYHYTGSVSRDLTRQNTALVRVLRKHRYEDVCDLYRRSGYCERLTSWGLYSLCVFRKDWENAELYLSKIESLGAADFVLEPDGPVPMSEEWRIAFSRAVLALVNKDGAEALRWLSGLCSGEPKVEVLNNYGVALSLVGRKSEAVESFREALNVLPRYVDAKKNLESSSEYSVTYLPLRSSASRDNYS